MILKYFITNFLIVNVFSSPLNDLITDYFVYKQVSSVVSFTLNHQENFLLMRCLSYMSIKSTFLKLEDTWELHRLLQTDYYKLGVVIDVTYGYDEKAALALSEAANHRFYGEIHCWLIISHKDNLTDLIDDSTFNLSTDFVIAVTSDRHDYLLYDLYNPFKDRGGKLNVTFFGTWNKTKRLYVDLIEKKFARRSNLHGIVWRVSYFSSKYRPKTVSLKNHLRDSAGTGKNDGLARFGYSVVTLIAEIYNASVELREYGTWKKGDKSGPMSRALESDEIDMTGSMISMIPEKLKMLKFVYPAWPFRTCFMFRSPESKNIKVREIFRPFDRKVWITFFGIVILFITVMIVISRVIDVNYDCSNAVLLAVGSVCQQATSVDFTQIPTRIAFLVVMMFSFIMYDYYSACVVSARLSEPIMKLKDSLISLAKTDLKLGSEPMIYFEFLMKDNGNEAEYFNNTRWQKVPESERFMLPDKGMALVKEGGFAYHTHPDVGYSYINRFYDNREICELTEVTLGRVTYRSIAISHNSTYEELTRIGYVTYPVHEPPYLESH